jgi:hypothetical protein
MQVEDYTSNINITSDYYNVTDVSIGTSGQHEYQYNALHINIHALP